MRLLILLVQVEQVGRADALARQSPAGRRDGSDAPPRRLHSSHADPEEVLAAVPRFFGEVRWFDAPALDERFQS